MNDNYSDQQTRLVDKYQDSINIYWSALLTINGLILTFFSIDALSPNDRLLTLNYILVCSCILSIWLILWNFKSVKNFYLTLGKIDISDMPDIPQEELKKIGNELELKQLIEIYLKDWKKDNLEQAATNQKSVKCREEIIEILLFLETILIIIVLIQSS